MAMLDYASKRFHHRRELGRRFMLDRWIPGGEHVTNSHVEVQAVDISPGGIGIATTQELQVGEVVRIQYALASDGVTLPIYSEVMWSAAENGSPRAGLRFLM